MNKRYSIAGAVLLLLLSTIGLAVSCSDRSPNEDMISEEYKEFQEWKETQEKVQKRAEVREIVYEVLWEMGIVPYWAYDDPYYPDPYYPEPRMMPVEPDGGIGDTPYEKRGFRGGTK